MPLVKVIKAPKSNSLRTGELLEVGKQYDMSEGDANRWIRRGVVEPVEVKQSRKPEVSNEPQSDSATGDKSGHAGRGKGTPAG